MKLYHHTKSEHLPSILKDGLNPNSSGIVYLSPLKAGVINDTNVILEVETGDLELTAFEDCREWEVLCWGRILPENISVESER